LSFKGTNYFFAPTWSTELEQLPSPTCTPASDFGPVCSRLKDAYSWRVTHLQSQILAPTGSILAPGCSVLNLPTSSATLKCYLEGGSWEASYWPKPLPTGSALCRPRLTYRPSRQPWVRFFEVSFGPSTTASFLTVRKLEEDILTLTRGCSGSNKRRFYYYHASVGFLSVADLVTVRAESTAGPMGASQARPYYRMNIHLLPHFH
jgi:hypothetical protein